MPPASCCGKFFPRNARLRCCRAPSLPARFPASGCARALLAAPQSALDHVSYTASHTLWPDVDNLKEKVTNKLVENNLLQPRHRSTVQHNLRVHVRQSGKLPSTWRDNANSCEGLQTFSIRNSKLSCCRWFYIFALHGNTRVAL